MDARRESARFRRQPIIRCNAGKRFPQVLTSMSNARKCLAKNVTLCRKRTLSDYKYATNSCRNFSNPTKHSQGVLRLYECSRNAGLLLVSQRNLQEKPRGGSRGAVDTHSFRPLVQEEKVSFGEIYSSPCLRVNLCLASSRKSAADSILER